VSDIDSVRSDQEHSLLFKIAEELNAVSLKQQYLFDMTNEHGFEVKVVLYYHMVYNTDFRSTMMIKLPASITQLSLLL
jgi:hypothetical protein